MKGFKKTAPFSKNYRKGGTTYIKTMFGGGDIEPMKPAKPAKPAKRMKPDKPMPKEYNWRKYDPDSSWYMEGDTTFAIPPKARGRRFSRQYKKDKKWRKE